MGGQLRDVLHPRCRRSLSGSLAVILAVVASAVWSGDVDKGRAIYETHCVACHNKDLKGNAAMARKFKVKLEAMDLASDMVRDTKDEELKAVILTGKSGRMPAFSGKLAAADIGDVLAYARSLRGLARGFGTRAKSDAEIFVRNFFAARCSYCHGKDGKGNIGMDKTFKVQRHAMDLTSREAQALKDDELAAVISYGKGHMPAFSENMTPEEVRAMVAYLRSLAGAAK